MKTSVTALGEILIDMTYAGKSKDGQTLFEQNPGGAPANVLAAITKLGGKTAFIGKIGNDMHGEFLRATLKNSGIDDSNLISTDEAFTTLAFVSLTENGERNFSFARKPGADTLLNKEEIDYEIIMNSMVFHFGSLSLTDEPSRTATFEALKCAKENDVIISYDPNYRPLLWKNSKIASEGMKSPLSYVDIIKISDEETEIITGEKVPERAIEKLVAIGIKCVIITLGKDGAVIGNKNGNVIIPSAPCDKIIDTTGAGDSFMGGFLYKLCDNNKKPDELSSKEIEEYGRFASRVAAYCIGKRGGINAMPSLSEIE